MSVIVWVMEQEMTVVVRTKIQSGNSFYKKRLLSIVHF